MSASATEAAAAVAAMVAVLAQNFAAILGCRRRAGWGGRGMRGGGGAAEQNKPFSGCAAVYPDVIVYSVLCVTVVYVQIGAVCWLLNELSAVKL